MPSSAGWWYKMVKLTNYLINRNELFNFLHDHRDKLLEHPNFFTPRLLDLKKEGINI